MSPTPRVAVIGAGNWGRNLVRNFAKLGALVAVSDANTETLKSLQQTYPGIRTYADLDGVLADGDIDAFAVATPSTTHAVVANRVLETGRPVFIEKPLCLDFEDARRLRALAIEKKLLVMVGHLMLYHPAFQAVRKFVDAGDLGTLKYIYSNRLSFRAVPDEGNALSDLAPHDISMILSLVGELPERVTSSGGSSIHPQVADTTLSHFGFKNGLHAHLFVSWVHPFKDQRFGVVGEKGMIVFDDIMPGAHKLLFYPHEVSWDGDLATVNRGVAVPIPFPNDEPLAVECRHFLDCIVNRAVPRSDIEEAWRVLSVLDACQRSLTSGRAVEATPD